MPKDVLSYTAAALSEHRQDRPIINEDFLTHPNMSDIQSCCIYAKFREESSIFCDLHPNKNAANANPILHNHDFLEITYVHRGCFHQYVNGKKLHLTEGSVMLLNYNTCHQPWVSSDSDIVVNVGVKADTALRILSSIGIHADMLTNIAFGKPAEHQTSYLLLQNPDINALCTEMFCEYFAQHDMFEQLLLADLLKMMIEFIRNVKDSDVLENSYIYMSEDNLRSMIKSYIEDHYAHLDMDTLCQNFHFSHRHMRRLLRGISDDSLPEMINRIRIKEAQGFIQQHLSVEDIISRVGFNDTSYFCRTFKRLTGQTVSEYSNSIRNHG